MHLPLFSYRPVPPHATSPKLLVVQLGDDGGGTQLTAVKAGAHDLQNGPYGSTCMQECKPARTGAHMSEYFCGCVPM